MDRIPLIRIHPVFDIEIQRGHFKDPETYSRFGAWLYLAILGTARMNGHDREPIKDTVSRFCEEVGISRSRLYSYFLQEPRSVPSIHTLESICRVLNTPLKKAVKRLDVRQNRLREYGKLARHGKQLVAP